jgi:ATP-dependent Clp protease adaptor protein ClpS
MNIHFRHDTQINVEEDIEVLLDEQQEKKLILHNDDYNTFDWVIESLMTICKHEAHQAEQAAYIVHYNGKCQVKQGSEKLMEKMHMALIQRGLTATVE